MEVSALRYSGAIGLHGRSPLLRLQSDERLVALIRRGNDAAFETLVGRYEPRLLTFCRHLLGSREDAEDVLQEVLAAAFNAILADDRPINVRPWLYRIARNRSLNHLRRARAVGVDSMDIHFSENGATTADKVHEREAFRLLIGDIQDLPETQRTALVLREMDALSYEQIAEAMETTVSSIKSLLVRARISLAEAAEARMLSCDDVRMELGEVAEGIRRRPSPLVRRHLRSCRRCSAFRLQLRQTNKALTALLPIGPMVVLRKLAMSHFGHSASSGATGATGATGSATAAGSGAAAAATTTGGGFVSATFGAIATKAVAGFAAAAFLTVGAVEVTHVNRTASRPRASALGSATRHDTATGPAYASSVAVTHASRHAATAGPAKPPKQVLVASVTKPTPKPPAPKPPVKPATTTTATSSSTTTSPSSTSSTSTTSTTTTPTTPPPPPPGRTQEQTDPTVLTPPSTTTTSDPTTTTSDPTTSSGGNTAGPTGGGTTSDGGGSNTGSPGATTSGPAADHSTDAAW